MKTIKKIVLLFAVILCFSSSFVVNAVQAPLIDTSKTGRLVVYTYQFPEDKYDYAAFTKGTGMYDSNAATKISELGGKPIGNITFKITQVVDSTLTDGKGNKYLNASSKSIALPTADEVKASLNSNDGRFTSIQESKIITRAGMAIANNLPVGIYLVQETDAPSNVMSHVEDFVCSLPTTNVSGNAWNYNSSGYTISVYPKVISGVMLTYDSNNGSGLTTSEPRTANKTEPLTENPFTNGNKVFLGWADTPTAKTPNYYDKQNFTMPDTNKTLYAVWGYQSAIRYYTKFKYSEPWGLKLSFALLNPNTKAVIDYSKYNNYGMYLLTMNSDNTDTPTVSEVIQKGQLFSNENDSEWYDTELTFNGSTDNYRTITYDKRIYTHNLANDIYVLTYVTYKGRTFWGTVKNRCIEDSIDSIIANSQIGLTEYTAEQVRLSKAIKQMYEAERKYYKSNLAEDINYPTGKLVSEGNFPQAKDSDIYSFSHATAMRAIDPWGLRLQARIKDDTIANNFDKCGCIVFADRTGAIKEELTVNDILKKPYAKYYEYEKNATNNTATLEYINNQTFVSCYSIGEIYNYLLGVANTYTVFYYVKDGQYYYDCVMKRNALDIANKGIASATTEQASAAIPVFESLINLYNETYYYKFGEYPTL